MKTVLLKQSSGLGDILFCLKIASYYTSTGYNVIFPIIQDYLYIKDYVKTDSVCFVNVNDNFLYKDIYNKTNYSIVKEDNVMVLPLSNASIIMNDKIMYSKYMLAGLSAENWKDYFTMFRNHDAEMRLYYDVLGLQRDEPFILVNRLYGSPPNSLTYDGIVIEESSKRIVEMTYLDGFTIFDWCKVIEAASEIHMIDSGLNYIIEKLDIKAEVLRLYYRYADTQYQLEGLFDVKWNM